MSDPASLAAAASAVPLAPRLDEPTVAPAPRARLRLAVLAVTAGIWMLPWLGAETGPARSGAPAALALVACWGLAATALLARSRRGLLLGEAATSAAVAALLTWLVAGHHPWLPGPDRRATWVPIFGPLALLALLDLASHLRPRGLGREIAAIRAAAALIAAGALLVALEPLPALVALFASVAPVAVAFAPTARAARRAVEALSLAAAAALFAAPDLHRALMPPSPSVELPTIWPWLYYILSIALVAISVWGVVVPEEGTMSAAPPRRDPA